MGASKKFLKAIAQIKLSTSSKATNNEAKLQKQSIRWNLLKSCRVIDQESLNGCEDDDDAANDGSVAQVFSSQNEKEEWAAIRIQTAFRSFLARRALCALRGLVRLQAAINGNNAQNLSMRNLRSIQTFVRTQAHIRAYRAVKAKGGQMVPKRIFSHTADSRPTENEDGWCDTMGSVEEIKARVQQKQEASIKRERALAYAFANQWRANSRLNLESLFDYELDNSTWSWIWLDRWINSQTSVGKLSNTKLKSDGEGNENLAGTLIELQRSMSADSKSSDSRPITPRRENNQLLRRYSHGAVSGLPMQQSSGASKGDGGTKQAQKSKGVRASKDGPCRSRSKVNEGSVKNTKEEFVADVEQKSPGSLSIQGGQGMKGIVDVSSEENIGR